MAYIPSQDSVISFQKPGSIISASVFGTVNAVQSGKAISSISGTVDVAGSVVATQGTTPWIITGSIQGSFSPATNQSVSGTVQTDVRGSVATVIIGGSIATSISPFNSSVQVLNFPANQSISGTVDLRNVPSILMYQAPGSILATSATVNPAANQSVSGTVQTDVRGSVAVAIIAGSIAASFTPPANQSVSGTVGVNNFPTTQNVSGSVAAFIQANPSVVAYQAPGSILAVSTTVNTGNSSVQVLNFPANQSVSGTVQTDVRASVATVIIGGSIATSVTPFNSSVQVLNFPTTQNVSGSVVATQGTNPWIITGSVQGSFSPAANQSVSGTVNVGTGGPVSVTGTMSVLGAVPVTQSTSPWIITGSVQGSFSPSGNQSVSGTVQTDVRSSVAVAIISGSIAATFTPPANQSVSGTVQTDVRASVATVIIGGSIATAVTPFNSSVQVLNFPTNQSVSGAVSVSNFPTTQNVSGSVVASGTIIANQGTGFGSIAAHIKSGSVIAVLGGNTSVIAVQDSGWSGSIVTFQGTSPWIINGSVVGITPGTRFRYQGSLVSGSVTLVAASVSGQSHHITDFWFANTNTVSSVSTVVTFKDGSTSILGYTVLPPGGGSNSPGITVPIRAAPSQDLTYSVSPAASIIYATINGYTV